MSSKSSPHEPVNEHSENDQVVEERADGVSQSGSDAGAKEDDKYNLHGKHPIIGLVIFCIVQFIALVLMTVATPIEVFVIKKEWTNLLYPTADPNKDICVTAWGMKSKCRSKAYFNRDFTHTFCYRVRVNFKIVEAFDIMTIAFMFIGLIMGGLACGQYVGKAATAAIGAFAMVLCVICFGVPAGMYFQKPCCNTLDWSAKKPTAICTFQENNFGGLTIDVPKFKDMAKYGPGFALVCTAFALEVIAVIFAILPF